jgi:hypothetical protein
MPADLTFPSLKATSKNVPIQHDSGSGALVRSIRIALAKAQLGFNNLADTMPRAVQLDGLAAARGPTLAGWRQETCVQSEAERPKPTKKRRKAAPSSPSSAAKPQHRPQSIYEVAFIEVPCWVRRPTWTYASRRPEHPGCALVECKKFAID